MTSKLFPFRTGFSPDYGRMFWGKRVYLRPQINNSFLLYSLILTYLPVGRFGAHPSRFGRPQNSNFSDYQRMWAAMEAARPSVFSKNNKDGVERVLKSKRSYAFLMESTSIEYEVERHCELMQIGNHLDSKGYGIAMPMREYSTVRLRDLKT